MNVILKCKICGRELQARLNPDQRLSGGLYVATCPEHGDTTGGGEVEDPRLTKF